MTADFITNIKGSQGVQGIQGVQGLPGTGATPADAAVAGYIGTAGTSATKTALLKNGLTGWYHVEGNGVVIDAGLTDSTVKMQEIFDVVPFGSTVYIPETGYDKWIKVSSTININMQGVRVLSVPRDTYASSIRSSVPNLTFFKAMAPAIVFENVGILGDATGSYGVGSTQRAIECFGDTNGNVDAKVIGCSFVGLKEGIRCHGRNALIEDNLFGGTSSPVIITGKDAVYHTGPQASDNRGHIVRLNRFHGCGPTNASALVYVDDTAQVSDLEISNNFSDLQRCRGYVVTGSAAKVHNRVNIFGNRSTGVNANMYELSYVNQFTINSESFYGGYDPVLNQGGNGIYLVNCTIGQINDTFGFQLNQGGVIARNCDRIGFSNVRFRQLGIITSFGVGHGFDVDASNTRMDFDNISAAEYTGWGFLGSPTLSGLRGYTFSGSAGYLGTISSNVFADDAMFVPAIEMLATAGTPTLSGTAGGVQSVGWLLDAATAEGVSFQVPRVPSDWRTYSMTALWAPTTATAGSVVVQSFHTPLRPGAVAGSGQVSNGNVTSASPAVANQVVATVLAASVTTEPNPLQMRVIRAAADAADTYAADIALLGVRLTRLS